MSIYLYGMMENRSLNSDLFSKSAYKTSHPQTQGYDTR